MFGGTADLYVPRLQLAEGFESNLGPVGIHVGEIHDACAEVECSPTQWISGRAVVETPTHTDQLTWDSEPNTLGRMQSAGGRGSGARSSRRAQFGHDFFCMVYGGWMSNWLQTNVTNPDSGRSLSGRARALRWQRLIQTFPSLGEMRVLDLGGTPHAWRLAPVMPESVVTVNLQQFESGIPNVTAVTGDACDLPASVAADRFDLVFSNSLLEHVGGHVQRQKLAENIHNCADRHWIQTPYRYFPVEPHWVFPGFQWLPYEARVRVSMHWNRGHIRTFTRGEAEKSVDEVELIGISQMRGYFPSSQIWYERFLGLIKSLVAIRS